MRSALKSLGVLSLSLSPLVAFAQDAPSVNYATLATATRDGAVTAVSSSAPIAFGLLATMLGIGIAWRLIKRGAKSV